MIDALRKVYNKWDKYTQGFSGTIIYILLGFLIAYAVNGMAGAVLDTDTPMVAVFSESMIPTFNKGDLVIVTGNIDDISVGDIIVFDVGDKSYPIIHRVYKIQKNGNMQTKGDNNSFIDPWLVEPEVIHGRSWFKIPFLGWLKVWFIEFMKIA